MKAMRIFFIALCCAFVPLIVVFGQTTNGTGGGKWNSASTWAGGVVPSGSGTVTIAPGDSVNFDVPVTFTGTLIKQSQKKDSIGAGGSVTFGSGSTYQHGANNGSIPVATWSTGSTCLITGVKDTMPSGSNQNFYNLVYNTTTQTGGLNLGMNGTTLGGDLIILGTGTGSIRLTSGAYGTVASAPNVITINGKVKVLGAGANLTSSGSGSPVHYVRVVVGDSLVVDGTTSTMLQLANGTGCFGSWWVKGNVKFAACTLNTNNTNQDSLVFCGTGVQTLTNATPIAMTKMALVVYPGSTLSMPDGSSMGNAVNDFFILNSGATFICRSASGLSGNITAPLANTVLSTGANYTFAGTTAQVTSTLLPATVNILTIDNAAGVTTSAGVTVTTQVNLTNGLLEHTANPVVLGAGATVVTGSGSANPPLGTGVEEYIGSANPKVFRVFGNYPNPFNPGTTISYSIPTASVVTVKVFSLLGQEVATLFSGYKSAGTYQVPFDASRLSSGVYLYRVEAGKFVETKRMVLMK
jgi:hypothetical protein